MNVNQIRNKKTRYHLVWTNVSIIFISTLAFLYHFQFSLRILDPFNISWLIEGDKAGALLGWLHFIHEDWQWPIGKLSNPMYQMYNSLSWMDAIPLVSVALKAIGFPAGIYQYHGYWLLLCYILQGSVAFKLVSLFTTHNVTRFFGTAFLTFSPIILFRTGHLSLCAHWIVLLSIYVSLKWQHLTGATIVGWIGLTLVSLAIHPYFVLFVLTFAFFNCYRCIWQREERRNIRKIALATIAITCICASAIAFSYCLGLLNQDARQPMRGGLHFYTADFFMFFNSGGLSLFGPELWTFKMGQYEGFSYIGMGAFILLLIFLADNWGRHRQCWVEHFRSVTSGPCLAAVGMLAFFSLGSNIRFWGKWIIDLRLLYEPFHTILSPFRSNGRFVWAPFYLILLFLVSYQPRNPSLRRYFPLILTCLFVLQILDISTLRPKLTGSSPRSYQQLFGNLPTKNIDTIDIVPPQTNEVQCKDYSPSSLYVEFNILAAEKNLKINSSFRAHISSDIFADICSDSIAFIQRGDLRRGTAYILQNQFAKTLSPEFLQGYCQSLSTHYVCGLGMEEARTL
jgi:hypothetical protein